MAGGLPTPRPAAEIVSGKNSLLVQRADGTDVTSFFESGAQRALELCRQYGIRLAVLKQGSPSCGNTLINDGSFSGTKIEGQGVTAALLQAHGISVYNELQIVDVAERLRIQG